MGKKPHRRRFKMGELKVLSAPPLFWLLIFFIIPVASVLAFSFARSNPYGGIHPELTLSNIMRLIDPLYLSVLWRSVVVAGLSTLITLALAFPAACYIAFSPPQRQKWLLFLVFLPLWTNLLVRLYSFMVILGDSGIINQSLQALGMTDQPVQLMNNPFAVVTGFVYWNLPYMIPPIFASLDRMNVSLLEASMDLGANRLATFCHIILPQSLSGVAAGSVLCFIPSLGCFIIPDILGGPDTMMIGNLITAQFQQGRDWPFGSALSTLLMLLVMMGISLYLRYYDPSKPQTAGNR
ncbi:MAG: ABC transporter permease [Desulfatirhabdiaceae bacterium]